MNFDEIRVPISPSNPSIRRIEENCVKCGMCKDVCKHVMAVDAKCLECCDEVSCINCGQCVIKCPTGAIVEVDDSERVEQVVKSKTKKVVFVTSPAVRVSLGEMFGLSVGEFVAPRMIGAIKALGVDYCFDTCSGADLTIMEESSELIDRIKTNKPLPMFTSCCPAWVKFVEMFYPKYIPNISTCKSPISMLCAIIKSYFANQIGAKPEDLFVVALTPCVAKKFEIARKELGDNADAVLSVREMARLLKRNNIDLNSVQPADFDQPFTTQTGASVIFGASGGVMEAAVRTAYKLTTGDNPPADLLNFTSLRGYTGTKTATIKLLDKELKLCVVFGTANARKVLDDGLNCDYLEVMACPNGCVGGGGQPKQYDIESAVVARAKSLYDQDEKLEKKSSFENEQIKKLYNEFLGAPLSEMSHKYLHTNYKER